MSKLKITSNQKYVSQDHRKELRFAVVSLTMVPGEYKAKRLSLVNHTTKTIHHHHQNQ